MPNNCFANCHMTPEEFGLWNYCRAVSYESKIVYLSGREVAKAFSGISKNVIYRIADQLVAKGWLRQLAPYSRNPKTGTLIPKTVYALDHSEWVAQYSATDCRPLPVPVPIAGQDTTTPVPIAGRTCPDLNASCPGTGTDLSRNQEQYLKDFESDSPGRVSESGDDAKPAHTLSDNQTIAGKIQAQTCLDFDTTANPYLLSAILKELDAGRAPKQLYEALKATKIEYNDVMIWKTLADNLPSALIQQDLAREREERGKRQAAEAMARIQAEAASEREEFARQQAATEALIEEELPVEIPQAVASAESA